MHKRLDGRDEVVLDPSIPIIDAHHHLLDRPGVRYLLDDYLADVALGHDVRASVYVEILSMARPDGPEVLRPLGEVEFANGVAATSASGAYGPCRVAAAIVGHADLRHGEAVGELLDRCLAAAPDRYRGIRQLTMDHPDPTVWRFVTHPPPAGLLQNDDFRRGFAQLAPRGLSFDAAVFDHQLPDLGRLAAEHPDTVIILNHMGQAMGLSADDVQRRAVFDTWRERLAEVSRHANIVCKVGGLGLPFWGFRFEERDDAISHQELAAAWRPYVETAIEVFGADRCMLESNAPADGRSAGFVPVWNALKLIVSGASPDEKSHLFHGTASRVYRIELPC